MTTPANWSRLRQYTDARIALGRAGSSQTTSDHLAFQLAHAQARDAVHWPMDVASISSALEPLGLPVVALHSAAPDRASYLQRPDWGRRLDTASRERLLAGCDETQGDEAGFADRPGNSEPFDVAFVVADGLSALAVEHHALHLLSQVLQLLRDDPAQAWRLAPLTLVEQGRVAVGDEVGACLNARCVVVMLGERPGLSSPDSLGVYITWAPRVGLTDAQRNCISNVRAAGLTSERAAHKLHALLSRSRALELTGIGLKDSTHDATALGTSGNNSTPAS